MKISQILSSFVSVLAGKLFSNKKFPLSIYWVITERCTNKCLYCNYKNSVNSKELKSQELSLEEVKKVLDQLVEAGCKKIQFTGGELLIREDICGILKHAKKVGLYIGISTSGVGLKNHPDIFKYVDIAFISFDGPPEIHNKTRNGNFYQHAEEAIKFFKQNNVKVFTTAVLTKINISSIDWILNFAKEHNIIANFIVCNTNEKENIKNHIPSVDSINDILLTNDETKNVIKYLMKKKREGYPIGSSMEYFRYLLSWKNFSASYLKDKHNGVKCYAGKYFAFLQPNGDLFACGDLYWRGEPQNVIKKGFKQAFNDLSKPNCQACINACYVEQNLMYSLNLASMYNWGLQRIKGKW